jgi:hypothetical protein
MAQKEIGVCKLTGESGKFVKSHLIPRALTLPRAGGVGFAEIGERKRPAKRFDSWYDTKLVTQAGEDILTAYDTYAVRELRRLKLIWQSWGPMKRLSSPDFEEFSGSPHGIRIVQFSYPAKMRLFFLSLLWRAAASDREEFAEIFLSASQTRRLRRAVREEQTDLPDDFFPIILNQISTRGFPHNQSALAMQKVVRLGKGRSKSLKMFRFYFDGLVSHIHYDLDEETIEGLQPMMVGPNASTVLSTVTWEGSWQGENLSNALADAEYEFPGATARADGFRAKGLPRT